MEGLSIKISPLFLYLQQIKELYEKVKRISFCLLFLDDAIL